VIPTLILLGLVFGHWWKTALAVAAVGWPLLLIATGVDIDPATLPAAAALAVANAAIGILVHQALWLLVRGLTSGVRRNASSVER
jgi:hypothetical protein